MIEFLQVLHDHAFLQNAVLMGFLASIACGIMGTYVVIKRISFISGGIAHTVFGGLGIAYFYGTHPLNGAIAAALIAAVVIGLVSTRARQHEDTVIGAIWAIGMALGVLFISRAPGYNADLMSYLFGNILMVSRRDIYVIAGLDGMLLALVVLFYNRFLAVCFDEEHSRLQGVFVDGVYLLLLCMIALTVVILVQVVGIILVIALLTLPAAVAGHYAKSLSQMMILATLLGIVLTSLGLFISYSPNLPAGATIIVLAGVVYLVSVSLKSVRARFHIRRDG